MRTLIVLIVIIISGCGITRSHVNLPDGTECQSTTYTLGKDISGGRFNGCGATWGVESSDPNAQLVQGVMQMMNFMVPLAAKGMALP